MFGLDILSIGLFGCVKLSTELKPDKLQFGLVRVCSNLWELIYTQTNISVLIYDNLDSSCNLGSVNMMRFGSILLKIPENKFSNFGFD